MVRNALLIVNVRSYFTLSVVLCKKRKAKGQGANSDRNNNGEEDDDGPAEDQEAAHSSVVSAMAPRAGKSAESSKFKIGCPCKLKSAAATHDGAVHRCSMAVHDSAQASHVDGLTPRDRRIIECVLQAYEESIVVS